MNRYHLFTYCVTFGFMMFSSILSTWGQAQDKANQLVSGIEQQFRSAKVSAGEDFYSHVNEGWLEKTPIPDDQSNYGSFTALDDATKAAIKTIIEDAGQQSQNASEFAKQVGAFYRSYLDTPSKNDRWIGPLQSTLASIRAIRSKSDWARVAGELNRIGIGGIVGFGIEPDARRSDEYAVYVSQSGTTLPDRDYYLVKEARNLDVLKAYRIYIADMMAIIGHGNPNQAAQNVIDLETQFAEAQWTQVKLRDPVAGYNKKSIDELQQMVPAMDWPAYAKAAGLPASGHVIVGQPSFFETANKVFESSSLDALKDFLLFSAIDSYAPALAESIERRHFDFHSTVLSGVAQQKPLWRRGVEACNSQLGMVVGRLYVDKHFSAKAKQRMEVLVGNLKKAFEQRIQTLEWMGNGTKKQALEKLSQFSTKIGYPEKWKDYSSVVMKPDDLFGNLTGLAEFEHQYALNKLGKPIDRTEWFMPPQTINAYYNPLMNEIVFPAAILQPPFFNLEADDAVNYGGIGAVIGHEISHGFDDSGSQFDGRGNLRDWWTENDKQEFQRRSKELVSQYNTYKPFQDMSVNGELTLGENIGDLGGLSVAYNAYRLSLGQREASVIDGLSGDQRFFMGWSQIWRRKYREPELRKRLLTDPHSPSHYRVIGIVSNMDAFYQAFDVKPGDGMYIAPDKRVRIW